MPNEYEVTTLQAFLHQTAFFLGFLPQLVSVCLEYERDARCLSFRLFRSGLLWRMDDVLWRSEVVLMRGKKKLD